MIEATGPALYGIAMDGPDPGPAYPSPQPFIRGEKQWMDNSNSINAWSDYHTLKAQTRIPYASTFMQTNDDVLHEDINDDTINLDILYEKEAPRKPNELEKFDVPGKVPLDFHFVETREENWGMWRKIYDIWGLFRWLWRDCQRVLGHPTWKPIHPNPPISDLKPDIVNYYLRTKKLIIRNNYKGFFKIVKRFF